MTNPLAPVWDWYQVARDSMRITLRAIEKKSPGAITRKHVLHDLSATEATNRIKEAQRELDNMAVVAMVAVFERALRAHLVSSLPPFAGDKFSQAVQEQLGSDIEYWHLTARVIDEVFKHRVSSDLCGMVKQIIDRRNKVAHGHVVGEVPPGFADPPVVFKRLTAFLQASKIVPAVSGS